MTDRYTKAVLTIIAVCLVVIASRGTLVEKAVAEGQVHVIVDQFLLQLGTVRVHCENCR